MSKKLKRSDEKGRRYTLLPISPRRRMTPDQARVYLVIASEVRMATLLFEVAELNHVLENIRAGGNLGKATYGDEQIVKMAHSISESLVAIERRRKAGLN